VIDYLTRLQQLVGGTSQPTSTCVGEPLGRRRLRSLLLTGYAVSLSCTAGCRPVCRRPSLLRRPAAAAGPKRVLRSLAQCEIPGNSKALLCYDQLQSPDARYGCIHGLRSPRRIGDRLQRAPLDDVLADCGDRLPKNNANTVTRHTKQASTTPHISS